MAQQVLLQVCRKAARPWVYGDAAYIHTKRKNSKDAFLDNDEHAQKQTKAFCFFFSGDT